MENRSVNVAVIGDGSWATAIVKILSEDKQHKINWWVRQKQSVQAISTLGFNPNYLTGVQIDTKKVTPNSQIEKVVEGCDFVILVIPAAYIKSALDQLPANAFDGKIIISAIKGIIPEDDLLVTDFIKNKFGVDDSKLAIISGPCHAEEVALGRQSYLTIGANDLEVGAQVADLLRCRYVNVSCAQDLVGIEYAAIMKNIVALACGIANGQHFGDNFQAVLVSNAMQEIKYFLDRLHPAQRDVNSSAYLGDLLVTSYSQFSRNRTFGNMVGRGYSVKSAMFEMKMVAEGYYAANSIYKIIHENQLNMPICSAVYRILYDKIAPAVEMQLLKELLK